MKGELKPFIDIKENINNDTVREPFNITKKTQMTPFITNQYARNHLREVSQFRDKNGDILSNRGDKGRYFPNAQDAYFKDKGYARVTKPRVGDTLIYLEVEGPMIEVKMTKRVGYDFTLDPVLKGKPFEVDIEDNGSTYFLLKHGTTVANTISKRENALRKGPHTRNRLSGGTRKHRL
jgi:hypothetical protein